MEANLAKDETLIREYDYAVVKSKKNQVLHSVIVTDKRIIAQEQGPRSFQRNEMPIDHADYITTHFDSYKHGIKLAVLLIILGGLLAVGGFVWSQFTEAKWYLILSGLSVIALIGGIVVLIVSLLTKGAAAELEIRSRTPIYEMLTVSASGLKPQSKIDKIKIKVDKDVAEQLLNEIGAIVIENKKSE